MKFSELEPWQKIIVLACEKDPGLTSFLRVLVDGGIAAAEKHERTSVESATHIYNDINIIDNKG